ncbi:LOW QUALITY PROTEIN: uncharacterized protein C2orf91 homolog, partial [Carlito syrichta]|uniref:LOW QUALITY PROTEIN: uncharacterized protein C2orf91 homolog n=1 Tax=Carlito syrichta TaxID=1868482 RepID=A0A1U7UMS0_CARSF
MELASRVSTIPTNAARCLPYCPEKKDKNNVYKQPALICCEDVQTIFFAWSWRALSIPSQTLPLTHGPEDQILQWRETCRQGTALQVPFGFLRHVRDTSQLVTNKVHKKASVVQLPQKQGTDQSRRGTTSAVTRAKMRYPESESSAVYLWSYLWNSSKGPYL